jgi:tetratricopeptide (TPR) repeat protein
MSPVVKQELQKALDLFRRGKEAEGFAQFRGVVRVSSPETSWPVEAYCREQVSACAPLQRSLDKLKRLNDEGIAFFQAGKREAARERFAAALALDPSDLDSLLNAANAAAEAAGDLPGALRLLDRAVQLRPAKSGLLPAMLNSRAGVLARLDRVPEAEADLREALRLAPKDWPLRAETEAELRRLGGGKP